MAKVCGPFDAENTENSAIAVQLFKTANDLARVLDRVTRSAAAIRDLHQPKVISYRLRLREICERLMFVDPVKHGKKAEDFLWKKVHYDVISLAKKLKKTPSWTLDEQYWLKNHIRMGLGTYHHLIFRLQSEYVYLEGGENFADFVLPITFRGCIGHSPMSAKGASQNKDKVYEWALQAYQRCLICMGDLARYYQDYFGGRSSIASRYYHQALLVCSESSMPFNQLGTLVSNNNYGFDSVYFYLRCTLYNNGFDGARANLLKVFDRNRLWLETSHHEKENPLEDRIFEIRQFLSHFIKYTEYVYKHPIDESNVPFGELCSEVIMEFQKCLEINPTERITSDRCCTPQSPCHLPYDVIFKLFVIAVMCIEKLEKQESSDTSAATAFFLASFSNLLNYILIEMQVRGCLTKLDEHLEDVKDTFEFLNSSDIKSDLNDEKNLNKRRKLKTRSVARRRKPDEFEDSDLSEGCDTSDDNEWSDENGNDSEDSVENNFENEEDDDDDDKNSLKSDSSVNSNSKEMIVRNVKHLTKEQKKRFDFNSRGVIDDTLSKKFNPLEFILSIDQLIVTVKVCCDWLENHLQIILASAQGSKKLWERFVTFINLLTEIVYKLELNTEPSCNPVIVNKLKEWNNNDWSKDFILSEELTLSGLGAVVSKNNFKMNSNGHITLWLSELDQVLLRTALLRRFAYVLTKYSELNIQYMEKTDKFVYVPPHPSEVTPFTKGESREQKQNLMQNMAQLWLEAEVKELESSVQLLDRPRFSPYLIPDISVLLTHLDLIAQLMSSKIFIFILPLAALQHLDEKKKESSKARKAIRWLETEFQKHNRYLRAQKRHERVTLPLLKYPKRRDKEAWNVFSVLECAKYFSSYGAGSNDKSSSACLATILVTTSKMTTTNDAKSKNEESTTTSNNLVPLARSSDLKVESVVEFYNKWKSSTNKSTSGKKSANQK